MVATGGSGNSVKTKASSNHAENDDANHKSDKRGRKMKKRKSKRLGKSKGSNRNVGHKNNEDDADESRKQLESLVPKDDTGTKKEQGFEKKLKKKISKRGSSKRDGLGDGIDDTDKSAASQRTKKKAKGTTDSESRSKTSRIKEKKKKKKKEKIEQKEEETEGKEDREGQKDNHPELFLEHAMKRVSTNGMENPTEILLIGGDTGVGKTTWIEKETRRIQRKLRHNESHDSVGVGNDNMNKDGEGIVGDENRHSFPVICRGKCERTPLYRSNTTHVDCHDDNASSSTTTPAASTQIFNDTGCGSTGPPMHAITEALNHLIRNLTTPVAEFDENEESNPRTGYSYGGRGAWRKWFSEALGTAEASYLASTGLVPELGFLMDLPEIRDAYSRENNKNNDSTKARMKQKKKPSLSWDWNTPFRFHRSCLAVRDLLRAVTESRHPLIMVIDDLHEADEDTVRLLSFLLTGDRWDQEQIIEVKKTKDQVPELDGTQNKDIASARLQNFLFVGIYADIPKKKNRMLEKLEKSFVRRQELDFMEKEQQILEQEVQDGELESLTSIQKPSRFTKIRVEPKLDRVEEVLRLSLVGLNEYHRRSSDGISEKQDELRELAEITYKWSEGNTYCALQVVEYLKEKGAVISSQPPKFNIEEVRAELCGLKNDAIEFTCFRLDRLPKIVRFALINASAIYQTRMRFSSHHLFLLLRAAYGTKKEFPFESVSELEKAFEIACKFKFMKRLSRDIRDGDQFAFSHSITRDAAYSLFKKRKTRLQTHLRLGTEALAMAVQTDSSLTNEERNAFKILAADQMTIAKETSDQDPSRIALLFVEIAEMCVSKSALCTATYYLKVGMGILERNGGLFTAYNHAICIRMHLMLARMHSICYHDNKEVNILFNNVLQNVRNLKDQIMLRQAQIEIFVGEKKYQKALEKTIETLDLLGQQLPSTGDLPNAISCEFQKLIEQTRSIENSKLFQPHNCAQRKMVDVMSLFSDLLEISRLCKNDVYQELAMIRMMNISLIAGFTRQYSTSFVHYGASLIKESFATNNFNMSKEGYRMGKVCEKVARMNDFHGGQSLAMFHYYISHIRRPYRLSLGQVLDIYNKQLECGDYFHIRFTMFTYIQYHLASGHDLTKLDENLQLFDALFHDYKMKDNWKIQLPQRFVANMLGEASNSFLLFGYQTEDQEAQICRMEEARESDAVNFMHFLILFTSIFFQNFEVSRSCLRRINKEIVPPLWKPWIIFFQCLTDILSLPNIENKANRKRVKETINENKDRLTDWYNEGFSNCSVMVSLLDAESIVSDPPGKKPLPALKIKKIYDDAIAVARQQELKHIEALCFERASMQFEAANANGLSAEYMARARRSYIKWNAVAKVREIEQKHAQKLKFSRKEKIVGAGYVRQNSNRRYNRKKVIGGRPNSMKSIKIKDAVKKAEKVKDIVFRKYDGERNNTKERPSLSHGPSLRDKFARMASLKLKKSKRKPSS